MIFATETSSAISISEIVTAGLSVLAALTFIATYLRASFNKSNLDIKDNTISTLKENNEALTIDRESWKQRALTAEGKVTVLNDTITAAPEIAKLAEQTARQHKESMRLQEKIITELKQVVVGTAK